MYDHTSRSTIAAADQKCKESKKQDPLHFSNDSSNGYIDLKESNYVPLIVYA